jgi:cytochrome c oxidase subunit 1
MDSINVLYSVLISTHHILIGYIYLVVGILGGSIGFALSVLIRLELGCTGYVLLSALQYNSCITFHGLLMIFFMIMPILIGGLGNILIPLMMYSKDMVFPRLNALSA